MSADTSRVRHRRGLWARCGIACLLWLGCLGGVSAQPPAPGNAPAPPVLSWQQCATLGGDQLVRLQCYDNWAAQQPHQASTQNADVRTSASDATRPMVDPAQASAPVTIVMTAPASHDCKNPGFSELSRFWELEAGSDCGTFGIRGYRPISLSLILSDSVNTQPNSPAVDHTTATALPYSRNETRIQLSVRTKIVQGLLTGDSLRRDSLWFGYTQQSYWQLFNGGLSRPFRTTDHEPEVTYVYPSEADLPWGWRLRFTGLSVVHQSNGQSLPLSRSWNRAVLMAGIEKGNNFRITGRVWQRMPESAESDDNPGISNYQGRSELAGYWDVNRNNTLGLTVRYPLKATDRGSLRLEWFKSIGNGTSPVAHSGLRLHTQLFSGYGDSLVDYNRRRTVLSVGLSLVDW